MDKTGKYIYGVIPRLGSTLLTTSRSGQVNSKEEKLFSPYGISACEWVYTISYQDISAVVSNSEIVDGSTTLTINPERAKRVERVDTSTSSFDKLRTNPERVKQVEGSLSIPSLPQDGERKSNRNPERSRTIDYTHMRKDTLARLLVRHQEVLEKIMNLKYTVIPVRLGTFAQDEREVEDILSKGYNLIKEIFERISDKIEIDVVASWSDFNSIIKEAGEEKEIKEFKERLLAGPEGVTVDDQMKIGFMVKEALGRKREVYSQEIQTALKSVSQAFKSHELMDDKMVFNGAFLIDKHDQKDFDRKLEELDIEFNPHTKNFGVGVNFRCVGPLPPYSFYTIEIKKLKFEEIDWARKKLGLLNDITSKDELKKAYQGQAFSTHPDKNPNNPCAEKEFDEVNKAYKILADYCVALEQANPVRDKKSLNGTNQQDKIPFDREMFKENAILVRVRE